MKSSRAWAVQCRREAVKCPTRPYPCPVFASGLCAAAVRRAPSQRTVSGRRPCEPPRKRTPKHAVARMLAGGCAGGPRAAVAPVWPLRQGPQTPASRPTATR
eukprot:2381908-Pyramimonas_sp.AAC.1